MSSARLLIVSQHFYPENFRVNDLAVALLEEGFSVDVLCGHPNYPTGLWYDGYDGHAPTKEDYHGVTVYRTREIPRKGNTPLRIFLNYISWPISASIMARKLKPDYDAVLCYNTSPVLMILPASIAAKRSHCPLITYVLDLWPENLYSVLPIKNRILRAIAQEVSNHLYDRSTSIITLSSVAESRLRGRLSGKHDYYVLPQHAEDVYAEQIEDEELRNEYEGKRILVFAGNLSPAQNLDVVIKAVAKAHNDGFDDLFLLILGDGMSRGGLEEIVKDLGATEYIAFQGQVDKDEIPRYTSYASALIMALSASDGLSFTIPAKLASYMAAGRPIIASIDGAPADLIKEAKCGFVCQPDDVDALSEALMAFRGCPDDELELYGARAFTFYENNFSRQKCVKKLSDIIISSLAARD